MSKSQFWARFHRVGQDVFRYDTRIYLEPIVNICSTDTCVGAVVAKNPGSAKASNLTDTALQQILLDKDKMLPTVRNIVQRSYAAAGKKTSSGEYIQVLNLFYLCNKDLRQAIKAMNKHTHPLYCQTEANSFPWIWYLWGDGNKTLSQFKPRFFGLNTLVHFYLDKNTEVVITKAPDLSSFPKHTQGLNQKPVIAYLSSIL